MENKRTLAEIDAEIEATKEELKNVKGTETEVYARIVGYYRSVRNWNKGKADEFKTRKMFEMKEEKGYELSDADKPCECCGTCKIENPAVAEKEEMKEKEMVRNVKVGRIEMFYKETCPNCPPVKEYVSNLKVNTTFINAEMQDGFDAATKKGVMSAPTVIIYDSENEEIARAHSVGELVEIFELPIESAA